MTPGLNAFASELRQYMADSVARIPTHPLPAIGFDNPFEVLARRLFALQFEANAPFRSWCEATGRTPSTVAGVADIPAVPAAAFKEFELSCLPPPERTTVFHSSGTTTQRPSRHFHSPATLAVYEASLRPWFDRHLRADLAGRPHALVSLTPPPSVAPRSSLVHMLATVGTPAAVGGVEFLGAMNGGDWVVDAGAVLRVLERHREASMPVILAGTAFNFVHLLDGMAAMGRDGILLPAGSCVMETGGYKGRSRELERAELHAWISGALSVPPGRIVCEYGMSELSSQAYDRAVDEAPGRPRRFRFPPWCRAMVVSPETGQLAAAGAPGYVRLVDLANVGSVLAIQTEDIAVDRGDGLEWIGRGARSEPRGCSRMTP